MRTGRFLSERQSQGLVEYAIILALVAVVVILSLSILGISVRDTFCQVAKGLGGSGICSHYCNDTFANMGGWTPPVNGWQVTNGQLCNKTNAVPIFNSCSNQNNIPKDYAINISVATLFNGNGYGVFFRLQSTNPTNGYVFQYDPGLNAFVFRKWINGAETGPFASAPAGQYNWYNTPRKIQVLVQGNTFKAYVDNVLWLTATDSTYTNGGSGLRTWDNTQACFKDFSVDPLP